MDSKLVAAMMKSPAIAVILTILFGGLGLFYASIIGGIVMTLAEGFVFVLAFITLGIGGVLFVPLHLICVLWSIIAVTKHNKRLLQQVS